MGTVLSRGLSHIVPRLRGKVVPQSAKRGRGPSGPQVVEKVVGKVSETRPLGVKGHGFAVGCVKGLCKKVMGMGKDSKGSKDSEGGGLPFGQ